jgi:hypothetical protein
MEGARGAVVSSPWPDDTFERDLDRLLRRARKTSASGPQLDPVRGEQLVRTSAVGDGSIADGAVLVLLDGDDLVILQSLQTRLAGSSRRRSGLSGEEARSLLVQACDRAVAGSIKSAIAELRETLERPLTEFEITEPVELMLPVPRLVVGRTTYMSKAPTDFNLLPWAEERGFVPPFATTRVTTRAYGTARILAQRRFAESLAILDLARPPANPGAEVIGMRAIGTGSQGSLSFTWSGPWVDARLVSRARLIAPLRQLANAAGRDEDDRTDWEQRLVAATRWFSKSYRTEIPGDRLAGAMVALECLFLEDRNDRPKGPKIAARLTFGAKMKDKTEADQIAWLEQLWEERNSAIHEGRDFVEDLDVDRLINLTRSIVLALISHLDRTHRSRGACRTWREAMECVGVPV